MVDRIQRIIQIKKLSSSKFADQVGVPRSTISHILSGRNNPSLEFLMKILDTFPDVNTSWLVRGEGPMQHVSNSLFRDEDFLSEETESHKSHKKNIEEHQIIKEKMDDLSKENVENQYSKSNKRTTIPLDTAHILESPSQEAIKSPSKDDNIEGANSNKGGHADSEVNPENKNMKASRKMDSDEKLSTSKKADKIIIIYHDGTFSEHIPSS